MQNTATTGNLNIKTYSHVWQVVERFKFKFKYLKIIVYRLQNGEEVMTLRQAAVAVRKSHSTLKEFIRKVGVQPKEAKLPNHCKADMIPLSVVEQYWKYLNRAGIGNLHTQLGEEMLANYLNNSTNNTARK